MTVSITNPVSGPFAGNGATTAFPFTFKAMAADEVQVLQSVAGAAPAVVSDADYTVTLNATEGGTVTFDTAPATGTDITIVSNPSFVQDISFTNAGAFLPQSHDEASDREAIRDIYLKEQVGRAIKAPVGESIDELPVSSDRAGQFFAFDADGNPVAASGTGADAALRTDLAANSGFTLIKYKNADANAYGRSGAQLKALGADDSDGLSLIHFINPNEDDALIANSGVSALDTAFTNALANLSTVQSSTGRKSRLLLPGFVYPVTSLLGFDVDDLVIEGAGAKITSTADNQAVNFAGASLKIRGVHFDLAATGVDPAPYLEFNGTDIVFEDNTVTRAATAHIPCYVRSTATGLRFRNNHCTWYGGVNMISNCKDIEITGNSFINPGVASDDGIAIKAVAGVSENILIADNYFENMADFVGIGSEIGASGATDSTYSNIARGITITGNRGKNCTRMLMVKPGGVDGVDVRDGTVRGVTFSDNTLLDESGTAMLQPIFIVPGRGARIYDVTGRNNKAIGRCTTGDQVGLYISLRNDGTGTADVVVDNIDIGIEIIDPYKGAASGGSAPGYPFANGARVEKADAAHGTATGVTLDVTVDGTLNSGILIDAGLDDAVYIRRANLKNIAASLSSSSAGIETSSRIAVDDNISYSAAAGSAALAYKKDSGGDIVGHVDHVALNDVAAGSDSNRAMRWAAPRSAFVHRVEIVNMQGINHSADDANYTQHEIRNEDAGGGLISADSSLTTGMAFPTSEFNQIYDSFNLSTGLRSQCFYTRGQRLSYTKNDFGSGNALTDAYLRIHWAPF